MTNPPSPQADVTEQQKAERMRTALAFLEVFGKEGKRTANQRLVMEHLERGISEDENTFRFGKNQAVDGISAIAAGIHRDGAQTWIRIIKRQISSAEEATKEKTKPKVKR